MGFQNLKLLKIPAKYMYNNFKMSEYYFNLTKALKLKYNKAYFINEISENVFLSKYYCERKKIKGNVYSNVLTNYIKKTEQNENNEDNIIK